MTANWKIISNDHYRVADKTWITQSDASACVIYSFAWSRAAAGAAVSGSGRATRVLSRDESGWRTAREHLSTGQWGPRA